MTAALPAEFRPQPIEPEEFGLLEREADAAIIESKARRLGEEIADAADADQWAITLVGHPGLGAPDFEELVPRWYLEGLSGDTAARYRLTLVLQAEGHDLGIIRLSTFRPHGFTDDDIRRARLATVCASEILERLISVRWASRLAAQEPESAA